MKHLFLLLAFISFLSPEISNAQNFTATLTYEFILDADSDGFADPGDSIRYMASVKNLEATAVEVKEIVVSPTDAFSIVPNSITTTFSSFEIVNQFGTPEIKIPLTSLPSGVENTITFEVTLKAPLGFESGNSACTNARLTYPDGSGFIFEILKGEVLGIGSCVDRDFDSDNIEDRTDICVNVPQSSPKLDLVIPTTANGSPVTVTSSINVSRKGLIEGVRPKILLNHTFVGDLKISLTHVETGKAVVLLDRPGVPASADGCIRDNIRAEFADFGFQTAENFCESMDNFAISGIFSSMEPLEIFKNDFIEGEWKLTIEDLYPTTDSGILTQWCMSFDSSTTIIANISAPQTSMAGSKFTQKLTLTNSGTSDMIDLVTTPLHSAGLTPVSDKKFSLMQLAAGESKSVDYEVTSASAFPYKEIIVESPSPAAGEYFALKTNYGPDLVSVTGVSGELVNVELEQFSCTVANAAALAGKIAVLGQVPCIEGELVETIDAANPLALILTTHEFVPASLILPIRDGGDSNVLNVTIPVLTTSKINSDKLMLTEGTKQVTLRANPARTSWDITSAFQIGSDVISITNFEELEKQIETKTEIQIDSDADGIADKNDQCINDPAKTSPSLCGCGIKDTDSDADGSPDCLDQCSADPAKTLAGTCGCGIKEPGVCGCGITDTDINANGIIDCRTGAEILTNYNAIKTLYKSVKPVKLTQNKKKNKAKKALLKLKTDQIKTLLSAIDGLVKNPVLPVVLKDASLNLSNEVLNVSKSLAAGLKTKSKKFKKNKKAAENLIIKILGLIN